MNIGANGVKLAALTTELARHWEETRASWRDSKADAFEEEYIETLLAGVNIATIAIRELDEVIATVRSECE
ncbi:MAG: hypothetical protein AAF492_12690 [Verrucomicrobiota bacterium]